MRIFCLIFIFYLLFLSWQPCQDLAASDAFCSLAETQHSHLQENSPSENSDDCSPFCSCSCCQISTAETRVTFAVKSRFTASKAETAQVFYQNNYSQQHLNSIWQPPKFNFTA